MRTETVTVRHGEDCGPIDWDHEIAKDKPAIWREAEAEPESYVYCEDRMIGEREIIAMRMYDGWPYWKPRPALLISSPIVGSEWRFFDDYGMRGASIYRRRDPA